MKKVLITGALGQDGIILSRIFQKKNFEVHGFVEREKKIKISKVKYHFNNLTSQKKIRDHLKIIKPNIIIHLACKNETYKKRENEENYKVNYFKNLECTSNLLNSIIKVDLKTKLIFAGSSLMFNKTNKNHLKMGSPEPIFKSININEPRIHISKYFSKLKAPL